MPGTASSFQPLVYLYRQSQSLSVDWTLVFNWQHVFSKGDAWMPTMAKRWKQFKASKVAWSNDLQQRFIRSYARARIKVSSSVKQAWAQRKIEVEFEIARSSSFLRPSFRANWKGETFYKPEESRKNLWPAKRVLLAKHSTMVAPLCSRDCK